MKIIRKNKRDFKKIRDYIGSPKPKKGKNIFHIKDQQSEIVYETSLKKGVKTMGELDDLVIRDKAKIKVECHIYG